MNANTGELARLDEQERKRFVYGEFEPIPAELHAAAEKKLAGRNRAVVSLSSGGNLSKWARQQRKNKRKAAQESRRRNRR